MAPERGPPRFPQQMMDATPRYSSEQWLRIGPLLDQALDLEPGPGRRAYLDQTCGADTELRGLLERLLAADEASGEFLQQPAETYLALMPDEEEGPPAGTAVGPFRLVRQVGRGGMGLVYLAERADGQFAQEVALKLVRAGRWSGEVHRRFLAERQILARLDHPHIARLVDGGLTGEGRPWFAMEFVDGEPLVAWCDARGLGIEARLRLFLDVGAAVAEAHRRLVVHRDLKPSNILVRADGQLKLLDFGIAKLLDPEGGAAGETRTELRMLTPEYAAPEQVRGEAVTTATDVYALGAILYELLTGQRVHRLAGRSPGELERVVCETAPVLPSLAASHEPEAARRRGLEPGRLRRRLAGDLDTVILRALQKEPARRYPSVDALVADLQRHLAGLPVEARPDSLWYRGRKFVGRHWIGVAATFAVLFAAGAGLVATLRQARLTAAQAARTQVVKDFLVGLFDVARPGVPADRDVTARELLERGVRHADSSLASDPAVHAEMLQVLGEIYRDLGLLAEADSLLRRALAVSETGTPGDREAIAARQTSLGAVLKERGEYAPAESLLRTALASRRARLAPGDPRLAFTLVELGSTLKAQGQLAAAESLYRAGLQIDVAHYGPDHPEVAVDLENLAVLLGDLEGDYPTSDSMYRAAIAIQRRALGPGHVTVLSLQGSLAGNLVSEGDLAGAESLEVAVLAGRRRVLPPDHPDIAYALHSLGRLREEQGRYAEAESLYASALAIRRVALGPTHPTTLTTLNNLAVVRYREQDFPGAAAAFREVLAGWRRSPGPDHPYTMTAMNNLGAVLTETGDYPQAEAALQEALRRQTAALGDTTVAVAGTMRNLGVLAHRRGRLGEAREWLAGSLARYRAILKPEHPRVAEPLTELGRVLVDEGAASEAVPLLREAVRIRREGLGETDFRTAESETALAEALGRSGGRAEAEGLLRASLAALAGSPWARRQAREAEQALAALTGPGAGPR